MRLLLGFLWLALAWSGVRADFAGHLILSEDAAVYREAAAAFQQELAAPRGVRVWTLGELEPGRLRALTAENQLIVPIGLKAAREVAREHAGRAAVLSLMLPRVGAEQLAWPAQLPRRKVSHVPIDQPASRSLGLIAAALPQASRVGLVLSGENADLLAALRQEAARRHFSLRLEQVTRGEEVAPALRELLPEVDALLLLPDSIAMHAGNARNVLLTTYRHRTPAVGFSEGLSRAGAVASLYSTPAQIGRQGARMAARWQAEGELPPPRAAEEFSVDYNRQVARSLNVELTPLEQVRARLGAAEAP